MKVKPSEPFYSPTLDHTILMTHVCILVYFLQREDDIPLVEWWDADLLPNRTYADCEREVPPEYKYREITNLVEHPIPVQTVGKTDCEFNVHVYTCTCTYSTCS